MQNQTIDPIQVKLEPPESQGSDSADYVIHEIRIKSKRGTGVAIGVYDQDSELRPSSLLICTNPSLGATSKHSDTPVRKSTCTPDKIKWEQKQSNRIVQTKNVCMFKVEPGSYSVVADEGDKMKVEVFGPISDNGRGAGGGDHTVPRVEESLCVPASEQSEVLSVDQSIGVLYDVSKPSDGLEQNFINNLESDSTASNRNNPVFDRSKSTKDSGRLVAGTANVMRESLHPVRRNKPAVKFLTSRPTSKSQNTGENKNDGHSVISKVVPSSQSVEGLLMDCQGSEMNPMIGGAEKDMNEIERNAMHLSEGSYNLGEETDDDDDDDVDNHNVSVFSSSCML
jgi:hypothetical protein